MDEALERNGVSVPNRNNVPEMVREFRDGRQ